MLGYEIKQSSSSYPLVFLMIDSGDHISGKTGLSPTVTISKNGGSFASPSGAVTEIANGWYKVAGNSTDSNTLGPIVLHASSAGADPADAMYPVVIDDPHVTIASTVWDEILSGATHNISNSAGKLLRSATPGVDAVVYPPSGTVTLASATSTTATLDAGASAVSQAYQWNVLNILTGTGAGQSRIITNYTTGRVATVTPAWTTTPDATSTYDITPTASVQVISYAVGQDPASLVLVTPANKLSTDASGRIDLGKILGTASAGTAGYAGLDWGAMLNKTTSNALTGTTISASQVAASVTGAVGSVTTVSDKTGYSLSSSGLDSVSTTAPSGVASNFREMMVQTWRRLFKKSAKAVSGLTIKTYADDGTTVLTTQAYTDDGAGNETLGASS